MSWSMCFFDPIILPDCRKLMTLRDAATYITGLHKAEADAEECKALLLVAERDGPELMARVGVRRALSRRGAKPT
ncbi:hypothetical protein [Bradyrhizobium sp. McL0616]|uniref:hypothetical protein n=1 Tax=Bradyrhizobium sp. McL0616 TaxID=3415674 RepID=UPI003CEBB413